MSQRIRTFFQNYHPIVYVLLIGTAFSRAASSMSLPFLAIYLAKYTDMDPFMIGITIGMGSLAGTVGGFFGGNLSDRFGRKRIMLFAIYLWGLIFIGFALTSEPIVLLLLNMLNGICRSSYEPVSQALMADVTKPEQRFRVFSLRYICINIGVAIGPLLGVYFGLVNGKLPWLITGSIYLLYAVVLHVLLNTLGIKDIQGEKKELVTLRSAGRILSKDAAFRYFILGGILVAIGYSQMTVTLSQYVEGNFTNGVSLFAWMMTVNAIVVIIFQLPFTRWAEKHSPLRAIVIGNILYAIGDVGFAFSSSWWAFLLSMVVFTWGEVFTFPAGTVLIDRIAPEHLRGTYYGAQQIMFLGHFIGPWFGGFLLQSYSGKVMFITVAVLSLCATYFYRVGESKVRLRPS